MTRNTRPAKALRTMRELSARGFHDRETLVQAAADALGGDDGERIARKVYRANFDTMEAN
jgi:hypothetical protein